MLDQAGLVKTCPFSLKTCELMYERAVAGQMGTRGGFGLPGSHRDRSSRSPEAGTRLPAGTGTARQVDPRKWSFGFSLKVNFVWVFFFLCLKVNLFFFKGS